MGRRVHHRRALGALVLSVALVLVGCDDDGPGEGGDAPPDGTAEVAEVVEVVALDNTFRPNTLTVAAGTEVHFVNRGRNEHNVLSVEEGEWGVTPVEFAPGAEYVHVFSEPGEYRYYCSLHGTSDFGMMGVVIVEEAGG